MAKITSASPNTEERIKELEKYKRWSDRNWHIREEENKRIATCPEIQEIISPLETNIEKVKRATTPKSMQNNFDILLVSLMTTAYDKIFESNGRPCLKTQINRIKHKILLDLAYEYANAAKKKSKK